MREILFKAKRKDNKEWVYGWVHRGLLGNVWYLIEEYDSKSIEVIPETICEYTGLKDKNGVKIFENDNLKMFQIDYDSETENGYGESTFEYKEVHIKASLDFIYSYQLYGEFLDDIEVIGNNLMRK